VIIIKKKLKHQITLNYELKQPIDFKKTFYSPTRFKSGLELYDMINNWYYLPLNLGFDIFGLKFYMQYQQLSVGVFSEQKLGEVVLEKIRPIIDSIVILDDKFIKFYEKYSQDRFIHNIIQKDKGIYNVRMYSLYEKLIVSTYLQNATVQRTIDMCQNMLDQYGTLLQFDNIELNAMWQPKDLTAGSEELRALKVGYRDKNILRITDHFVKNEIDEQKLWQLPTDQLEKELLKIYGVGKQTVFYIIGRSEYLKHISPWERKILSKYIFDKDLCEEKFLVNWFKENYKDMCGLAFSLIFNDIFDQHKKKPFLWLQKIMRE